MKVVCIQFYTLKNIDDSKIKIIELQKELNKKMQDNLNLDKKYKYIEDNLKKYFNHNLKMGKIKILIKNFKDNFYYIEVVVFNQILEAN